MNSKDRERLIALLGMMGSDQDGEALNASRLVCAFMKKHKLQWKDTISSGEASPIDIMDELLRRKKESTGSALSHKEMAEWLLNAPGALLTQKERSFVNDMLDWNRPTAKQMKWLGEIYEKNFGPP